MIEYILRASNIAVDPLTDLIREVHPKMPQIIQTTADRLRQEGEARGLEKGRLEGKAQAIIAMLECRDMLLSEDARARILKCQDEAELDRLVKRVHVVDAVTELFAGDDSGASDR